MWITASLQGFPVAQIWVSANRPHQRKVIVDLALRNPSDLEEVMKMFILPYDGSSHSSRLHTGLRASTFVILEPLLKLFNKLPTPRP